MRKNTLLYAQPIYFISDSIRKAAVELNPNATMSRDASKEKNSRHFSIIYYFIEYVATARDRYCPN